MTPVSRWSSNWLASYHRWLKASLPEWLAQRFSASLADSHFGEASGVSRTASSSAKSAAASSGPSGDLGTTGVAPYNTHSGAYRTILSSGGGSGSAGTITNTLGGLTIGRQYQLQWWASDAARGSGFLLFGSVLATVTNTVSLDPNTTDAVGGLGQFVIGSFTADSTTQSLTFDGVSTGMPLVNAFQVRAVPEPSTCAMALAGLACGGCTMFRRRNRTDASRFPLTCPLPGFCTSAHESVGEHESAWTVVGNGIARSVVRQLLKEDRPTHRKAFSKDG
jgi:hypothetical protein